MRQLTFITRVGLGLFFAKAGWGKVFTPEGFDGMVSVVSSSGIPFPVINAAIASGIECFGGLMLILGLATPWAALGLMSVMGVALFTNFVAGAPGGLLANVGYYMYLPETLYILLLWWVTAYGGGPLSVDAVLKKRCCKL